MEEEIHCIFEFKESIFVGGIFYLLLRFIFGCYFFYFLLSQKYNRPNQQQLFSWWPKNEILKMPLEK